MTSTPKWVESLKPSGPQGHELLDAERRNSGVNDNELATFMFSESTLRRDKTILDILKADPVFDKRDNYYAGRIDRIRTALQRGKRLQQLSAKHDWSEDEYQVAYDLIGEATPYGLHAGMFIKTLKEQCTLQQQAKFLEAAINYEIIGCYAQTELGHGSNVKGIETTATWMMQSQTFEIHSPYLTASKWWIGSLGKAANHAVVMAQLYIEGKNYGPHLFLVQIRDLSSHEPLPGVHVGDIGPKVGFNTMDNGFLLFKHLHVPHENMLAKFAKVDPATGKYHQAPNPSLVYGTMTWVSIFQTPETFVADKTQGTLQHSSSIWPSASPGCHDRDSVLCCTSTIRRSRQCCTCCGNPSPRLHYGSTSAVSFAGCHICTARHREEDDSDVSETSGGCG